MHLCRSSRSQEPNNQNLTHYRLQLISLGIFSATLNNPHLSPGAWGERVIKKYVPLPPYLGQPPTFDRIAVTPPRSEFLPHRTSLSLQPPVVVAAVTEFVKLFFRTVSRPIQFCTKSNCCVRRGGVGGEVMKKVKVFPSSTFTAAALLQRS